MLTILALALFAAADPSQDASNVVGLGGGATGLASFGFVVWLVKMHRDERRDWRDSVEKERQRVDAERAREREECRKDIAELYAQISELWKRLAPEKAT